MSNEKGVAKAMYLVCGAAMGAAAALLMAPRSGKELREDLADWQRKSVGSGKTAFSWIPDLFAKPNGKAKTAPAMMRNKTRELAREARELAGAGRR